MTNVITWNMMSLDGLFEAPGQNLDWFAFDADLEKYILDTQSDVGMLLFGRVTYEFMRDYWTSAEAEGQIADFMNSVPKVVFSKTLESADWNNTRLVSENIPEEVARLKQEPGGDIFVFGSADFSSTLMRHGLIDEYRIGLNPVVLGSGTPLFKESPDRLPMTLIETQPLDSGLVILHYKPTT